MANMLKHAKWIVLGPMTAIGLIGFALQAAMALLLLAGFSIHVLTAIGKALAYLLGGE